MSICSDRIHPKVKVDVVALRRVHVPEMRIARKVKLEAWFDDLGQNCRKNTIELHEKIVCDQVPSIIECLRAIGNTVDFENADVGAVAEADVVASDCQSHYIGFSSMAEIWLSMMDFVSAPEHAGHSLQRRS